MNANYKILDTGLTVITDPMILKVLLSVCGLELEVQKKL